MIHKVTAVVGAQYGSEGKGVVVHKFATWGEYEYHVRTGGPNAGHSFIHEGQRYTLQSVPCGFVDPKAALVLGAGAVINPRVLKREVFMLEERGHDIRSRLFIDPRATVLDEDDEHAEGHTTGELHHRIGSTGEGVGAARHKRMRRNKREPTTVADWSDQFEGLATLVDTVGLLGCSNSILLEGTQGSGLSLVHGKWPYVTSADTNTAQLCADAGVSPLRLNEVVLVARTMPIRVAGNSGPLANETDWDSISEHMGRKTEERTTVTKKTRRIGQWDDELFARAVLLNGPSPRVALTFLDYINPKDEFVESWHELSEESKEFVMNIHRTHDVSIELVGTGVHPERGWTCIEV